MYYVVNNNILLISLMFECTCGKTYKYASGLNNHKEKCGGGPNYRRNLKGCDARVLCVASVATTVRDTP